MASETVAPPMCQIQWIDEHGQPTPDDRPSIGRVYVRAHVQQIHGRGVPIPESLHYEICAAHARQLAEPGMHEWVWEVRHA